MASLRDIRKHIKAVKNIKQITYAMKMISSARIKKAQNQVMSFRPYMNYLGEVISSLRSEMNEDDIKNEELKNYLKPGNKDTIGLIVISGDKGLCGAFNTTIINSAIKFIKNNQDKKIYLITVGKKATDFFKRIRSNNIYVYYEMYNIFPKVSYTHASLLSSKVLEIHKRFNPASINFIYMEFRSMIKQELKNISLLPLVDFTENNRKTTDYIFEPEKDLLLVNLIPKYINMKIYSVLIENQISELVSRMNSMELASKNAGELVDELTIKMNKLRQAQITTELTEIVSGANAIQ